MWLPPNKSSGIPPININDTRRTGHKDQDSPSVKKRGSIIHKRPIFDIDTSIAPLIPLIDIEVTDDVDKLLFAEFYKDPTDRGEGATPKYEYYITVQLNYNNTNEKSQLVLFKPWHSQYLKPVEASREDITCVWLVPAILLAGDTEVRTNYDPDTTYATVVTETEKHISKREVRVIRRTLHLLLGADPSKAFVEDFLQKNKGIPIKELPEAVQRVYSSISMGVGNPQQVSISKNKKSKLCDTYSILGMIYQQLLNKDDNIVINDINLNDLIQRLSVLPNDKHDKEPEISGRKL